MLLEFLVGDLIEIQGVLDDLVTDLLVFSQYVFETVEFLGVLDLMFEQLLNVSIRKSKDENALLISGLW